MILSLIIACYRFGLTEVSKNAALNKHDFHVMWSAFLLTKTVSLLSFSTLHKIQLKELWTGSQKT